MRIGCPLLVSIKVACLKQASALCRSHLIATALLLCSTLVQAESVNQPTIAIIIDDMGNHLKTGRQLINLPYPMTLAFLPHRKHTQDLAQYAHAVNKEVMLHMPMANTLGLALGPGGLTSGMSKLELTLTLRRAVRSIPFLQGVNNHMGSALTQRQEEMQWVMEELYNYPLYFVDSRTIASSVAEQTAERYEIPTLSRDVFLDHWQTRKAVHHQFTRLIKVAKQKGTAVAIGHPHQVTADYLEWALPRLDEEGIRIATVSGLWAIRHNATPMFSRRKKSSITIAESNHGKVTSKHESISNL